MRVVAPPLVVVMLALAAPASAAPRHDICADLGGSLGVGISSFSAAGDWPTTAARSHGVSWRFLYLYYVHSNDPPAAQEAFLAEKASLARWLGAIPVYTFYVLLGVGQSQGLTGSEPAVVKAVLEDPALMRDYFDRFSFVLKVLGKLPAPVILQVEPDPWGFMIWAMGVEGNGDASSVPVKVGASGHPDLAGFPDHAGGLGKALLKLRDLYAPTIRLGWHASNFRAGTRPEVVADFYSALGEWDVLFTEQPHLEAQPTAWWEPWDETRLTQNLTWFSTVSQRSRLPLLLWQAQIGTTDWHLFGGDASSTSLLQRFLQAGLGGVLFDLRGQGDPDSFRAGEDPELATVPPSSSAAGGTAADLRRRLALYSQSPLVWPAASICSGAERGDRSSRDGGGTEAGGPGLDPPPAGDGVRTDDGCGCEATRHPATSWPSAVLIAILLVAIRRSSRSGAP